MQTSFGTKSISDKEVAGVATSSGIKYYNCYLYFKGKVALFWWFAITLSLGCEVMDLL